MSAEHTIAHGTTMGGLSTVPDLNDALRGYRDCLGFDLAEQGELPADLAASWGCDGNAGSPYAVLRPSSDAPCWFRLVEQADHPDFKPTTTYGWARLNAPLKMCGIGPKWSKRLASKSSVRPRS